MREILNSKPSVAITQLAMVILKPVGYIFLTIFVILPAMIKLSLLHFDIKINFSCSVNSLCAIFYSGGKWISGVSIAFQFCDLIRRCAGGRWLQHSKINKLRTAAVILNSQGEISGGNFLSIFSRSCLHRTL